jgi:hypothetical protein
MSNVLFTGLWRESSSDCNAAAAWPTRGPGKIVTDVT